MIADSDQPVLDLSAPPQTSALLNNDLQSPDRNAILATSQDAEAVYEAGFQAILEGDYAFAEGQFRQFLELFDNHDRSADATHWLGESLLQQSSFVEAADVFQRGFATYGTSSRAPEMLLKLGVALSNSGETEVACLTYSEVERRFPDTSNAFKARLNAEIGMANC